MNPHLAQPVPSSAPAGGRRASAQRGSIYMLVLGMGVLLTVIGLSVAVVARINARTAAAERNWTEAGVLAESALDLSLATLNADPSWRRNQTNDAWSPAVGMGLGSVTWKVLDEGDADLADDAADAVRIYGQANAGDAWRMFSVEATSLGAKPLPVLSSGLHSSSSITASASFPCSGGPVSCDGTLTVMAGVIVTADVEAGNIVNSGRIAGFVTTPAPAKAVPTGAILLSEPYSGATEIPYGTLGGGTIDQKALSPSSNPYGPANARGVYLVRVPGGSRLTVSRSIFAATLIVQLGNGGQLYIEREMYWVPPATGMPSLIAVGSSTAIVRCRPDAGTVNVGGLNVLGIIVGGTDAPSEIRGLFHVMGGASSTLEYSTKLMGTWICDGLLTVTGSTQIVHDPQLAASPPAGYTLPDNSLTTVPGTFRWERR